MNVYDFVGGVFVPAVPAWRGLCRQAAECVLPAGGGARQAGRRAAAQPLNYGGERIRHLP